MKTPIWITNFKNYKTSVGDNGVQLAKIHERVAKETGVNLAVAVSPIDVYRISRAVSIPVLVQHIDPVDFGKGTGNILPESAVQAGAMGTLLNHSERRLSPDVVATSCEYGRRANLLTILCAENEEEVGVFSALKPDFLAFEPPELIGSSTDSVASSKPRSIEMSVRAAQGVPLLVGAGIKSSEDVRISLELGARGFLVASAITKADDPESILRELVSAF